MAYNDKHPDYIRMQPEWLLLEDAFNGESAVKQAGEAYLPKTAGMINAGRVPNLDVEAIYRAYKNRAQYPEWVRDAVRSMLGMVLRLSPTLQADFKPLRDMEFAATADGFPLKQLFFRTVQQLIRKGRFGLLCDIDAAGRPFVASYPAESIINWKLMPSASGRLDLSLLVLQEQVVRSDDVYSHDTRTEYLVYRIIDGLCTAVRLDESGHQVGEEKVLQAAGKPLSFIPFVFAGAVDNAPDADLIPLSTMAKSALKYYQLSADYFQELHLTAHPQPVITGEDLDNADLITGPMMSWVLPSEHAKAFYLEISGNGIEAKRVAMGEQKTAALEAGARVMDIGGAESGEARQARQNDQYATLQSIVRNSAEAIEQCLRYLGEWFGLTAEEADEKLKFTVDADFNKMVDAAMLQQLFGAAKMGFISPETVWNYVQTGQLPERDWDDEQARILAAAGVNDVG